MRLKTHHTLKSQSGAAGEAHVTELRCGTDMCAVISQRKDSIDGDAVAHI